MSSAQQIESERAMPIVPEARKMISKYRGTCAYCTYPFRAGRMIAYLPEHWAETVKHAYSRQMVTTRCVDWECFYKLLRRDFDCQYCDSVDDLTIDHIVAVDNGGLDTPQNITVACRRCNSAKGTRHVEEFLDRLWEDR